MKIVSRAGFELGHKMQIEGAGFGGLSVDDQSAASDVVRQSEQATEDVLQHRSAETMTLVLHIDTQASQQGDRLRVLPRTLPEANRRCCRNDMRHAPCVIRDSA